MNNFKSEKKNHPVDVIDDVLEQVSGGISAAEADLENEYIKDETMIIIPIV